MSNVKKHFLARDCIGRVWRVGRMAVLHEYTSALMDMDGISYEEALEYIYSEEGSVETWWHEQVLPFPGLVFTIGELDTDIPTEVKEGIVNRAALSGYMENIE